MLGGWLAVEGGVGWKPATSHFKYCLLVVKSPELCGDLRGEAGASAAAAALQDEDHIYKICVDFI